MTRISRKFLRCCAFGDDVLAMNGWHSPKPFRTRQIARLSDHCVIVHLRSFFGKSGSSRTCLHEHDPAAMNQGDREELAGRIHASKSQRQADKTSLRQHRSKIESTHTQKKDNNTLPSQIVSSPVVFERSILLKKHSQQCEQSTVHPHIVYYETHNFQSPPLPAYFTPCTFS